MATDLAEAQRATEPPPTATEPERAAEAAEAAAAEAASDGKGIPPPEPGAQQQRPQRSVGEWAEGR